MNSREKKIVDEVCAEFGVSVELLIGQTRRSKSKNCSLARHKIATRMIEELGYSANRIANHVLKINPSSLSYLLNRCRNRPLKLNTSRARPLISYAGYEKK